MARMAWMKFALKIPQSNFLCTQRVKFSMEPKVLAVCQMTSRNSKEDNLKTSARLIEQAARGGAKMVFLPEACDYIGESKSETLRLAEPLDGPVVTKFRELAKTFGVWLSLGGLHERFAPEKVCNAHVLINSDGEIATVYRKIHLFDVDIPDKGIRLRESDYVIPGKEIIPPVRTPVGNVGLAICYDMRFPESSLVLSQLGAHILTFPSAFTLATGAMHWEVLLRARAIENQCYVVAAAQTGTHNVKRSSWGHAMVVDPWGAIVSQCSEGSNIALATINLAYIDNIKLSMPVTRHRRYDLYPQLSSKAPCIEKEKDVFEFGQTSVKADQIFFQTAITMAFTNKKCVVPGHVLVAPKRCVKRFTQLFPNEISDLFLVVQRVQRIVEKVYEATSSTINVQDGDDAGQTVNHVHVHVLPRKPGDFPRNDEVYMALEGQTKKESRTETEMAEEATILRTYFA